MTMGDIVFSKIHNSKDIPLQVKWLYLESFPEEERRPWDDIERRLDIGDPFYNLYVLQHKGQCVGFVTIWNLPDFIYVEHFAISKENRCRGFGREVISRLMSADGLSSLDMPAKPLLLEVELPETSDMAERRLEFYKKCGMLALEDVPYFQPPYVDGFSDVPMMLVASKRPADPVIVARMLHTIVYNQ